MNKTIYFIAVILFISACAPAIYKKWEGQIDKDITYAQVVQNPDDFKGKTVYWGGMIVKTRNTEKGTQIEVLQKPMDKYFPERGDVSQGRFLVNTSQFLDFAIYSPGRQIIVVGEIAGGKSQMLDQMEYKYPVIEAKDIELIRREYEGGRVEPGFNFGVGVLF